MSVLVSLAMFPLDKGESVSDYVSSSLDIIDKSGVKYRFGPMNTVLEGKWDEVMDVVKQCYERMRQDCNRIECNITIDYRNSREEGLVSKIASIEEKLGRELDG